VKRALALLIAGSMVVALTACCGSEPTLELRSPLWPSARAVPPTLVPTGYAVQAPVQMAPMAVPQYAAPAAPQGACGYASGYQFAPPPVVQPATK
jgi:hypothetical protein